MSLKKRIIFLAGVSWIIGFAALAIFTACDNRKAFNPLLDVNQKVSMSLTPSQLVIHSLDAPDTVNIYIRVRDENGSGIDSVQVEIGRTPEVGTVVPPKATEQGGYAQAQFITDPGTDEEGIIIFTAKAGSAKEVDTLRIFVSIQGEIGHMGISLDNYTLTADGEDQATIYVSVIDTTGVPIADGTPIFIDNYGASTPGTLDLPYASTTDGIATFKLTAPPVIDSTLAVDSLVAWGISMSGDTSYAHASITYVPAQAAHLQFLNVGDTLVAGSGMMDTLFVKATDANGNLVIDGSQIQFRNQLSTSSISNLVFTVNGIATAHYVVGSEAGTDYLQAFMVTPGSTDTLFSNAIPLVVRSSVPTNIQLSTDDQTIEVGGIATQIYATLRDENGNNLSDGFSIRFEITSAPENSGAGSVSFNYVPTDDSVLHVAYDSTDVNGRASVALFSGITAGTVRIKGTSVDNENIFKERPLITVTSGPPYWIDIGPSNIAVPSGEYLSTGITAAVWDRYTNPVEPGTAVHFEVIPDTVAYIIGAAYTGGEIVQIDSVTWDTIGVPGQAYTTMYYGCGHTFDTVRVVASSGDMEAVSGPIVLGIFDGHISVGANPGNIFIEASGQQWATSDISALLTDGLGCPIHNGVIDFLCQNCGILNPPYTDTTNNEGYAFAEFYIEAAWIPQTPPEPPQCSAKVIARLRGYPDVEGEIDIHCGREQ